MNVNPVVAAVLVVVGCGGNKPKPAEQPAVTRGIEAQAPAETPPSEAAASEPAVAKIHAAKAALEPVKGAKQAPGTVTFTQGSSGTDVTSDFSGLARGNYHLVIHEGTSCGTNAADAGPAWKGSEAIKLMFTVGGDAEGNVDESGIALSLDGVAPIVGQTLVLHADAKGAPGKVLACGTIDAVGSQ